MTAPSSSVKVGEIDSAATIMQVSVRCKRVSKPPKSFDEDPTVDEYVEPAEGFS
jgi:hypothetical protein